MTDDSARATETDRVRAVIEDWAGAIRAKDAERAVAHQADGFVSYSLAPPLVSTAADADGLNAWFATWRGPIGYALRDLEIVVGGDAAFAHGLVHVSGTKQDGVRHAVWFRQTFGLRALAGAWKVAHHHESVPFHMDGSYRAAVDLTPPDARPAAG